MIKRIFFIVAFTLSFTVAPAQDIVHKVAMEICNCVDTIENMDSLDAKLNRCAPVALETVLENSTEEVQDIYSTDAIVEETLNKAFEILLSICPKIRNFVIDERRSNFYRSSDSEDANTYYEAGNEQLKKEDLKGAIKNYSKAIKKDHEFIYAIDNMALAYRKAGDNKNAVKYYLKSLEIYPEGSFALQNLAVAYTNMKDYQNALSNYDKLTYYYPTDPEGYFGLGKVFILMEDYEKAIDYIFIAHKIYSVQGSDYAKETHEIALVIFQKFKEQNKLELFYEKAKEYGISVNEN
jgi:tetratricopeptide (TPR) repeat protein